MIRIDNALEHVREPRLVIREARRILKPDGRLRWISEPDRGQADAINKGWRMCKGEIVAYLNSDDTYQPGALDVVGGAFAQHSEVVMVYGDCYNRLADGTRTTNHPPPQFTADQLIEGGNLVFQPSSFYRRSALQKIGWLDPSLHYWMEYDLFIRLSRYGRPVYLSSRPLASFRVHTAQKSARKGAMYREARMISRRHGGRFFSQLFWEHHPRLARWMFQWKKVFRVFAS